MSHSITIAGKSYEVAPRYAEGHTLTANEASALNQTFFENLRNNFAGQAKEGADQAKFNDYVSSYQFGVRGTGGSRDPILVEAMRIARDKIKDAIRASGKVISSYSAESISNAAEKLLAKPTEGAAIKELAAKRVAEMQSNAQASVDDDLLAGLEPAKAAEQDEPTAEVVTETAEDASPSRRRAAAQG